VLRLALQALDDGPDAVATFLAEPAWTRLVSQGGSHAGMVLLEAAFERVRRRIAPDLPSRFEVVFAWRTLSDAIRFRDVYQPSGVIHCCAMVTGRNVERDGALIVEAFEAADLAQLQVTHLSEMEECAVRYWRGRTPMAHPEVLMDGTVVVEGIVMVPSP